jgi:hypothetical protein
VRLASNAKPALGSALVVLAPLSLLPGCAPELVVYSGPKSQGTLKEIQCELVRPWPAPNRVALSLAVETPCNTSAEVFVHVFRGDAKLASLRRGARLTTCDEPICEENKFDSGPFSYPGRTTVRVEVHTVCENGDPIQGAVGCQIP